MGCARRAGNHLLRRSHRWCWRQVSFSHAEQAGGKCVTSKMTKASNPVSRAFCRASKAVIGESCLVPSERFPTVRWSSGIMAVSLREFSFVPHERHYAYCLCIQYMEKALSRLGLTVRSAQGGVLKSTTRDAMRARRWRTNWGEQMTGLVGEQLHARKGHMVER
jgi:hypothetical protein